MSSTRSRGLLTGFAMVFATLLVTAVLGYLNVRRLYEYDRLVDHTYQVMAELRQLLGIIADAESGTRGFAITSDEAYLRPLEMAKSKAPTTVSQIQTLVSDNARQVPRAAQLRERVVRRLAHLDQVVKTLHDEGAEAARTMIAHGEGLTVMDEVRDLVREMEREESRLLRERMTEASTRYWTAVVSSFISAVIGLTLAVLGFWFTRLDMLAREQRAQDLAALNTHLEERVRERTAEISDAYQTLQEEVTERERAENQLREVAGELERSNRELTQFAAVASHDLQEPLRKIQAFGDRLYGQCHDQLSEKGRDYLDRMLAAAGRMRSLIDGLLEYSRVSTRRQPLVAVDLSQIAREVVSDLEPRLQQSGGRVQIDALPTIYADPLQMRQLFQNLIGNALKFKRPDTAPTVHVSSQLVTGTINGDGCAGEFCELVVEDNGIGFDPTYVPKIFELFQRLHGREQYEGTGMGLAICKKIAERHGGQITATSTPGVGSRFLVTLPLSPKPAGESL